MTGTSCTTAVVMIASATSQLGRLSNALTSSASLFKLYLSPVIWNQSMPYGNTSILF